MLTDLQTQETVLINDTQLLTKLLPLLSALVVSVFAKPVELTSNTIAERQVVRRHIFCEGIQ